MQKQLQHKNGRFNTYTVETNLYHSLGAISEIKILLRKFSQAL